MKCQILFSGKNKKNISKCRLLKILPRVLSVNTQEVTFLAHLSRSLKVSYCDHSPSVVVDVVRLSFHNL